MKMVGKNKTILITGGNGFVGANLVRKLVGLGYTNIFLILRESSNLRRISDIIDNVNVKYGTLTDQDSVEQIVNEVKPEIIYHLAAAGAYIGRDGKGVNDLFNTNIFGTINLLNACKEQGFEYFVNTGSSSEYGIKNHPIKEDDLLEPSNEYGISKASATMYCSFIGKKFSLPIYTFRIFSAFGPYEDKSRLIPSLMLKYINNEAPELSTPNSVRDFIFIDDIVNYYLNIDLIDGEFGGIFNLGTGHQHSIGEIVEMVRKISKSDINPKYGVISIKQDEPNIREADITKTSHSFKIKTTDTYEGLILSYHWYLENKALYQQ